MMPARSVFAAPEPPKRAKRRKRPLSPAQQKVREYLRENHGLLQRVATQCEVSIQFVSRIAYNMTDAQSKGLRVENALVAAGVPLIQRVR